MPSTFTKDQNAILDYTIDWSTWLEGDTITTSTWTVPAGITKDSDAASTTATTVWLSGGTDGRNYELVNHIVTAAGREDDRSITIQVRNK